MTTGGGISKVFIGMILLPIVGNTGKHMSAVGMSVKDRLEWGLGLVVGFSIVSVLHMTSTVHLHTVPYVI